MLMNFGKKYLVLKQGNCTQYSKTYLCTDQYTNEDVFIKVLNVSDERKEIVQELFKREVRALKLLNHESIVKYLDSGLSSSGEPFIVMEYFAGYTLYKLIQEELLNNETKFEITIKIIDAIIYSHEKNIIHRDIKPQNILIDEDYNLKIIDFGISKIIGLSYNPSATLKDYMTIRYAAPEQLQRKEVTLLSDLYSLGLVIAYIFIGEEPPESRSLLNSYLGKLEFSGIAKIVKSLIETDITKRPQSANKVKSAILHEKASYISNTQKINVRCSPNAMQKLRNVGLISIPNIKEAVSYILSDVKKDGYYGYKKKEYYYFIGDRIKYNCKLSTMRDYFNIVDINIIDDQRTYEKELSNGVKLFALWSFVDGKKAIQSGEDTDRMAYTLSDNELQKNQDKKDKDLENKLIYNWTSLLKEEYQVLNTKKNICNYDGLALDNTGDRVLISIDHCEYPIQIGDSLQLLLRETMSQKTIGQFIRLIDEKTILSSINQDANLDDFCDSGSLGIDVIQEKANLKRFSIALNQVKSGNSVNPKIFDIINYPSTVSMNQIIPLNKFYQDVFKDPFAPNSMAVKKALSTKDLFLLQGPPGTGKTTVISEIICQIINNDQNAKILLVSQSNVAVDHAVKKVSELLPNTCIVRIGRTDRISKSSEKLLYANKLDEWVIQTKEKSTIGLLNYASKICNSKINNTALREILSTYDLQEGISEDQLNMAGIGSNDFHLKKVLSLVGRWQKHLGKLDEFDEIFANSASIVAATCVGIASRNKLSNFAYDWVIIDEAARATPLETLIPMVKGKKILLVGDHKQLPPIVNSKVDFKETSLKKSDLEKSLFEDLFNKISNSAKLILTEQFRMHPAISEMINMAFYPETKITTPLLPQDRRHNILRWADKAVIWLDTSSLANNQETSVAFSESNYCEVQVITSLLEEIKCNYSSTSDKITVGVISGYDAQKNLLHDSVRPDDRKKWGNLSIAIDNVDAYQGSEVDIVIYSVVRSNESGKIGFLYDIRRLNVALSRGRSCLFIIGNYEFIKKANFYGYNPFLPIIRYIESNNGFVKKEVYKNE